MLGMKAPEIYDDLRDGLPRNFTFKRLQVLCRRFVNEAGSNWEIHYLTGDRTRKGNAGRPSIISTNDRSELERLIRNRCYLRLQDLRDSLYLVLENEIASIPSTSTIYNHLVNMGYSLKVRYLNFHCFYFIR